MLTLFSGRNNSEKKKECKPRSFRSHLDSNFLDEMKNEKGYRKKRTKRLKRYDSKKSKQRHYGGSS